MNGLKTAPGSSPVGGSSLYPARWVVLVLALTILVTRPVVGQAPPSLVGQPLPPPGSPVPRMEPPQLPSVAPGGMKLTPIEEGEVPETLAVPVSRVEVFPEQLGPELRPFTDGSARRTPRAACRAARSCRSGRCARRRFVGI